jgi:hypothetical protein
VLPDSSKENAINYLKQYVSKAGSNNSNNSSSSSCNSSSSMGSPGASSSTADTTGLRQQTNFVIYGGYCAQRRSFNGDVCVVTCSTQLPTGYKEPYDGFVDDKLFSFKWSISTPIITGTIPAPRFAHASVMVPFKAEHGGPRMFVVGGVGHGENFRNVHSLALNDLKTVHWEVVKQSAKSPDIRHGHSVTAITLGESHLPSGATVVTDTALVLYGGVNSQGISMNDVWVMRIIDLPRIAGTTVVRVCWDQIQTSGPAYRDVGCSRHEAACIDDCIFIFGGSDEQEGGLMDEKYKEMEPLVHCLSVNDDVNSTWQWTWGTHVESKLLASEDSDTNGQTIAIYNPFQGLYEPRVDNLIRLPNSSLCMDMLQLLIKCQRPSSMRALAFPLEESDQSESEFVAAGADITFIVSTPPSQIEDYESADNQQLDEQELVLHAHSCIIQSRCDVLRAMLSSDMEESSNKMIRISDCSPRVFFSLLCFLYTGTIGSCCFVLSNRNIIHVPVVIVDCRHFEGRSQRRNRSANCCSSVRIATACASLRIATLA